ncbi:MAG: phosphoethanolamine--lipid A transferase [Gammaproteobacteria bacterium]|nr:phosphoethanolamine--lipid A transferase [Gammaproteobacteria bacterium]
MKTVTSSKLIILVAVFLITFGNLAFFSKVTEVYPVSLKNIAYLGSLAFVFGGAIVFLLSLICHKYTIKPVLITLLLVSSISSYFMDSYDVIIDDAMVENIFKTDMAESTDLITLKMILYVIFLGVVPSLFVYKANIVYADSRQEIVSRLKLSLLTLALVISVVLIFGGFYASFLREHKPLRFYANPSYYIYSTVKYFNRSIKRDILPLRLIGVDAEIPSTDIERELIIFVVGETARADRFSINGYNKETNPLLKKENIVSFPNFWSCGTSTSVSVPCMFSVYKESEYEKTDRQTTENLLDVLTHAGVNVLWLDNNSDSKGVASRVAYESYKTPEKNPICDLECRDEGMLSNIQAYINEHETGDIFIVLHQMGNHGPAYYKRYPPVFEKFSPVCRSKQLQECSKVEIDNAYDNAILYTDYFLSKVIGLLKKNTSEFESALFYVSDHGESLGEHGLYLHGMPNFVAPDAQRHVPAIMWIGNNFDEIDAKALMKKRNKKYNHDNIFHTILGFMEIETSVYDKQMDILHSAK